MFPASLAVGHHSGFQFIPGQFSPLGSSVLKPCLDLRLSQVQLGSQLCSYLFGHVALSAKLLFHDVYLMLSKQRSLFSFAWIASSLQVRGCTLKERDKAPLLTNIAVVV